MLFWGYKLIRENVSKSAGTLKINNLAVNNMPNIPEHIVMCFLIILTSFFNFKWQNFYKDTNIYQIIKWL